MIRLRRKASVLVGDLVLVAAVVGALAWWVGVADPWGALAILAILPGAFYVTGLYELDSGGFRSRPVIQILVACVITGLLVATLDYLLHPLLVSRRLLVGSLGLVALLLGPWRVFLEHVESGRGRDRVPLVLLGANGRTGELEGLLRDHALFELHRSIPGPWNGGGWVRELEPLAVRAAGPARGPAGAPPPTVVVADPERLPDTAYATLLQLRRRGVRILDLPRFWEEATGRLPVSHLSDEWLALHSEILPEQRGLLARVKRMMDIVGSLVLLAVLAPPAALAAAALWVDDPGRVLFRQQRVGEAGRPFRILKLRTMRKDVSGTGPAWTVPDDRRITRVGRVVRRTRLDEVPQLVNVLRGEMSLVGPRPEAVELACLYSENIRHYTLRHCVKPGVTGWAQIRFPTTSSLEDAQRKLEYDLYYIHRMSPVLDARILLKTVYVVLFGRGGR